MTVRAQKQHLTTAQMLLPQSCGWKPLVRDIVQDSPQSATKTLLDVQDIPLRISMKIVASLPSFLPILLTTRKF